MEMFDKGVAQTSVCEARLNISRFKVHRLKSVPPTCQGCLIPRHTLVPVHSGRSFRVVSPSESALVTREVAGELERVLEKFGALAGCPNRVSIFFRPGIFGHHRVGRAVDIYAVGGVGIDVWKRRWDYASYLKTAERRNLGWLLYKTLQVFGRWAQPYGYPIQLFGPWTRTEGPWCYISDFLLNAHRDHIHVAK